MDDKFDIAFKFLLENEGGFVDDPDDIGGATKYGISLRFLEQHFECNNIWADVNSDGAIDSNDIRFLTMDYAKKIYRQEFWEPVKNIPDSRLATKVFDAGVNIGIKKAIAIFQRILPRNVVTDGIVGPITINAVKQGKYRQILSAYIRELIYYYTDISKKNQLDKYLIGWIKRAIREP